MTPNALKNFIDVYQRLDKQNLPLLNTVYSDDIVFCDALHETQGKDALLAYFDSLYTHLLYCHFTIHNVQHDDKQAFLSWTMHYAHPKLAKQQNIKVEGVSQLQYTDKITYHRDYADMGQMLYEHIPLLGSAIRLIKKRAVS